MKQNSISAQATEPSKLLPLIEAGFELIPLRGNEKRPRDNRWPTRPYKNEGALEHMYEGNNVGVRLRATDLVIDVDPRNFDDTWLDTDPFSEFILQNGLDPSAWLCVETGGGGTHYYFGKPNNVSIVDSLADFPGVEFKSCGCQVVAPGSVHPETDRLYDWDALDGCLSEVPEAPENLIAAIERKVHSEATTEAGACTPEQIAKMLEALDPTEYRDHEDWFRLMCACHHGSGGAARSEFIEWSISDPEFADHFDQIGYRWDGLKTDGDGSRITVRTLYRELARQNQTSLIPRLSAKEDFETIDDESDEVEAPLESDTPMLLANRFLKGRTLLRHNGDWFEYDEKRNRYEALPDERFKSWVWNWIDGKPYIEVRNGEQKISRIVAGKNKVANIEEAAHALRQGPKKAPGWIGRRSDDPLAEELLVCSNGLLHVPTRTLYPKTDRFFSVNGSPVVFDPDAAAPKRWLRFLKEIFPAQPDCIEALQEVTGYFLTQETSLQKIVQIVGPPRAGKGVYTRLLQQLVGEGNYTSPSTKRLSGEFGMQPLIGKQLAVISDMRMGSSAGSSGLVETLLTVSGEDSVSIPRKYKENWEGKLNTRFLLVSNDALQLRDTSNALGSRMIMIVMRQSFLGQEDEGLTGKLTKELSGILNWALDGLDRLKRRGHLVQPKSCMSEVLQMNRLISPVKWFLENELIAGPEHMVEKDHLWSEFEIWFFEEGLFYRGGKAHFIKDLNSAGARFRETRPRKGKKRVTYLVGLELKADYLERRQEEARRDFDGIED